eukprot:7375947-Prymnesium_polylepis.1
MASWPGACEREIGLNGNNWRAAEGGEDNAGGKKGEECARDTFRLTATDEIEKVEEIIDGCQHKIW